VLLAVTNVVGDMAERVAASLTSPASAAMTMAYLAAPDRIAGPVRTLAGRGIAVHPSVRAAVRAMAALSPAPSALPAPAAVLPPTMPATAVPATDVQPPVEAASGPPLPGGAVLTEWSATPLLDWAGVPRPEAELVTDPADLPAAVGRLGGRTVLKVQSPQVLHKSELGAVAVGIDEDGADDAGRAMLASVRAEMPDVVIEGVLVQRMCAPGVELLVGVRAGDRGYPATVTVGIGGTSVELYGDVATAFAPIHPAGARDLLGRLRGFPLLAGHRGRPHCDLDAAADAIAGLSRAISLRGLVEIEVNPLIVHAAGGGVTAVDLLVRKELP
jgi:acyl-CoA synthetase (NDP forming)